MKKDKFEIIKDMYTIAEDDGRYLSTPSYRNMLDNIHKGCYVEAESTKQGGTVVQIIRNKSKVPVCVKVLIGTDASKKFYDYISVDRISFYEPYSYEVPNDEYYDGDYLY